MSASDAAPANTDPVAERREALVPIHYRGFTIPNKFVFGFGLDLDEYYRNLPFVGVVDLEKYKPSSEDDR